MAQYALIDGYLDAMRGQIRWRKDLDDVVSEMEDHLYSTVEGLLATGTDPHAAQRTTLDRFGEPTVLAAVYASTPRGGLAVPTEKTKRAGTMSMVAGGLWLAAGLLYLLTRLNDIDDGLGGWQTYYIIFNTLILGAGVLTVLGMLGVRRRSGSLGTMATIGIGVAAFGVLFSVVLAWAVPFWMAIQGAGFILFAIAAMTARIAPRLPTLAVAAGFPIGVITWVALSAAEVGTVDEWGDYPVAGGIGGLTGMAIVGLGVLLWGTWLRNEEPVDIDSTAITA